MDDSSQKINNNKTMIKKVVKKHSIKGFSEAKENLAYWLSRSPEERVAAVDFLRKQRYGNLPRLQRVVRVIKRKKS